MHELKFTERNQEYEEVLKILESFKQIQIPNILKIIDCEEIGGDIIYYTDYKNDNMKDFLIN